MGDFKPNVKVRLRQIAIDEQIQRRVRRDWIARQMENGGFDESAQAVTLSLREDGTYHCVDGQHRVLLAELTYGLDYKIRADVWTGLSSTKEAELFAHYNDKNTVALKDKVHVGARAGEAEMVELVKALGEAGVHFDRYSKSTAHVSAVSAFLRLMRTTGGSEIVTVVAKLLNDAFDGNRAAFSGANVQAIGRLLLAFPEINILAFSDLMREFVEPSRLKLMSEARLAGGEPRERGVLRFISEEYNKRASKRRGITKIPHDVLVSLR